MRALYLQPVLAVILALSWGCTEEEPLASARAYRVGLYAAEQASLAEIRPALAALAGHRMEIMVAVPEASFPSDQLARLLQDAAAAGLEVRIWPLLPQSKGYWPNETNIAPFAAYVDRILAWLETRKLSAGALVYDMEPAITYSKSIEQTYDKGLGAVVALIKTHLDPAAHARARAALTASVKRVQAAGLRAQCVTFPQVLDDLQDGDDDLQDALDIPVRGVPFDEVSFMVYQSTYARSVGSWIGPDLIRVYAARARAVYGDRATIALGIVGRAGVMTQSAQLYKDPATLRQDVAAALYEKVKRVEVFSLDGMILTGKLDAWLGATVDVEPQEPESSATADFVTKGMEALDTMLDSRGDAGAMEAGAKDAGKTDAGANEAGKTDAGATDEGA